MNALSVVLVLSAVAATVLGTHQVCDAVAVRLRLARHRRRARRDGQMLRRALQAPARQAGEW